MLLATSQSAINTTFASKEALARAELHSRPAHEEEPNLQEAFENNNYYKPLDPEDFATDRGWWFQCRRCELHTRVRSKTPFCRHCGFTPNVQGAK